MTRYEYRAATRIAAVSGTAPFFEFKHAATAQVKVKRIICSGLSLTAGTMLDLALVKNSGPVTDGTAAAMTAVPVDKSAPATTATLKTFAGGAPTPVGSLGNLGVRRVAAPATATPSAHPEAVFDFGDGMVLVAAEACTLLFLSAPGSATSVGIEIVWAEEA